MTPFLIPSILALLVILGIWLNEINPWAGRPVPHAVKDIAALAVFCFLLYFVSVHLFGAIGGVR